MKFPISGLIRSVHFPPISEVEGCNRLIQLAKKMGAVAGAHNMHEGGHAQNL
jgi:hypothetical protein